MVHRQLMSSSGSPKSPGCIAFFPKYSNGSSIPTTVPLSSACAGRTCVSRMATHLRFRTPAIAWPCVIAQLLARSVSVRAMFSARTSLASLKTSRTRVSSSSRVSPSASPSASVARMASRVVSLTSPVMRSEPKVLR